MEVVTKKTNLESEKISAETAQRYLNNYLRACIKKGENPKRILKSLRIDRPSIEAILADKNCAYVRMYFGMPQIDPPDIGGDCTLMLVGVDGNNENILENGEIYDNTLPCPYTCPQKDFE